VWVGVGLASLGVLLAVGWLVLTLPDVSDRVDALHRAEDGTSTEFTVDESVSWTVFTEPGSESVLGIRYTLTEVGTGEMVTPRRAGSNFTYAWGSRSGRAVAVVDLEPGTYRLEVQGPVRIAIGPSPGRPLLVAIAGAILVGGSFVLLGIIIGVVSAVRDTRRRKALNEPPPPSPWTAGEWPAEPGR